MNDLIENVQCHEYSCDMVVCQVLVKYEEIALLNVYQ